MRAKRSSGSSWAPENTHVTGQIVFNDDGGADATLRGEGAW
ncbi:hypothetical protein [Streptomyces sp. NPDC020817]